MPKIAFTFDLISNKIIPQLFKELIFNHEYKSF